MESELGQELVTCVAARQEARNGQQRVEDAAPASVSKKARRRQAWRYLIPVFAGFWLLFAGILIASGFFFLAAALVTLALFSSLIIGLAWAFQNNL